MFVQDFLMIVLAALVQKNKKSRNRIGSLGLVTQTKVKNAKAIAEAPTRPVPGFELLNTLEESQKRPPVMADTVHSAIKSAEGNSLSITLPIKNIKRIVL